jgi:single-stranded DNA-binding protein
MSVNHIILVGTLHGTPRTAKTGGVIETRFLLSVDAQGGLADDLIEVVTVGDLAATVARLKEGKAAYVEGRVRTYSVPVHGERTHRAMEVIADSVQTL